MAGGWTWGCCADALGLVGLAIMEVDAVRLPIGMAEIAAQGGEGLEFPKRTVKCAGGWRSGGKGSRSDFLGSSGEWV